MTHRPRDCSVGSHRCRRVGANATRVRGLPPPPVGIRCAVCDADECLLPATGSAALESARYATDFNEVKALGAAIGSTRSPDQTVIALFWADGAGTETPPGHWNSIAQSVAATFRNTLDQNARLFALLNIAMADAAICAWDAKYWFAFWRPITAVRNAADDGNPATTPDSAWQSFIATPPFPEYVSGHSTFSGAAARSSRNSMARMVSHFPPCPTPCPAWFGNYTDFSAAAREAAESRLYGGIHFRSSTTTDWPEVPKSATGCSSISCSRKETVRESEDAGADRSLERYLISISQMSASRTDRSIINDRASP